MNHVIRLVLPNRAQQEETEADLSLAIFSAECLFGRPQTRLEISYVVSADGARCVLRITGPAGDTALRVFLGLCAERFGEDGFSVEKLSGWDEGRPATGSIQGQDVRRGQ